MHKMPQMCSISDTPVYHVLQHQCAFASCSVGVELIDVFAFVFISQITLLR